MPALIAKDVLERAQTLLQDPNGTHWPLPELASALNDALLEICLTKPSACAETVVLSLQEGTWQTLDAGQTQLLRVVRNITSGAGDAVRTSNLAITPIERDALDNQIPDWHDATRHPASATVLHVMTDPMNPTDFYVYPANDGNGQIEAMVAVEPTSVSIPGVGPDVLTNYTDEVDISPIYKSALIDYILYQSHAKDMQMAGASQRAMAHYQSFLSKLGVRRKVEAVATPDSA
ncbi:phage adaptor protein [Roseovarius nitratireducens]|uniref:phage adaptor protein n=1 Tax=Roseovarius nitratireducens TaxID=2044597 RepID=UPI000CE21584|nr:DUF6682 family protein [Roseovarius nitratireducens]